MITRRAQVRRTGPARPAPEVKCPTCRHRAVTELDKVRLRDELLTEWWSVNPAAAADVVVGRHCGDCQPHQAYVLACLVCGDGPLLAGELAAAALNSTTGLPQLVLDELSRRGWRPATNAAGWVCCQ